MITPPPLPLLPLPVGGCITVDDLSGLHPSTAAEVASEQTFNFYCDEGTEGVSTSKPVAILVSYVQKGKRTEPKNADTKTQTEPHADLAGWVGLHFGDCVHKVEMHIVDDKFSECKDGVCSPLENIKTVCVTLHYGDDKCISAKYKSAKEEDHKACVKAATQLINNRYTRPDGEDPDLSQFTDGTFYSVKATSLEGKGGTPSAAWERKKPHYGGGLMQLLFLLESDLSVRMLFPSEDASDFLYFS